MGPTTRKKKPEKNNKKPRINLDEAQKSDSAHNSNAADVGAVRGNLESVQKARDLQEAGHETQMAELKLQLAEGYHATALANEAQRLSDANAMVERMMNLLDESRRRESALLEKTIKTSPVMFDKAIANMLKAQMVSGGSNAETNILMGTALQNGFFSTSSTDGRMIEEQGEPQLLIKNTEEATD